MFILYDDTPRFSLKKYGTVCSYLGILTLCLFIIMLIATFIVDMGDKINVVYINSNSLIYEADDKRFLSVALDTVNIADGFKDFDMSNRRLLTLMKALSPGYLRIGGTLADRLIFTPSKTLEQKFDFDSFGKFEDQRPNFTMNGREWLELNNLAKQTGFEIIFDLNSLRRFNNGSWNSHNAERLIQFSSEHGLNLHWELGNEPNAFRHQFNYSVDPAQLGEDFHTLRQILVKYPQYRQSFLVGPDVTRPQVQHKESVKYLEKFLAVAKDDLDAITWHQYYFNGRTVTLEDFLDPQNFDILKWQIMKVREIAKDLHKPIWLGETSSAYGGGAPGLSNKYISTFIWLDKLGISAKFGLNLVIRQSIFRGDYALINKDYTPAPDFWISLLYKKIVSPKVVNCFLNSLPEVRLYCQCTRDNYFLDESPSVTVFGVNLSNKIARVRLEGLFPLVSRQFSNLKVHAYVFTSNTLRSSYIRLNGDILNMTRSGGLPLLVPRTVDANPFVEMPPYSSVFWVVPAGNSVSC